MKYTLLAAALSACSYAYPGVSTEAQLETLDTRGVDLRKGELNSGFFPNAGRKGQFIDVRPGSGHEFTAPGRGDVRGPCPGLNAASNHKFIDHTGVLDFKDTTVNLPNSIGLSHEFGTILFGFAVFNSGSLIDMKWSIGGPMKSATLGVLGGGKGISNSHNKYDGDASPGRGDAYMHNGDSHSLNMANWLKLWQRQSKEGTFNLDILRAHNLETHEFTKSDNPYGFFGPVFFVSPIAHQFIVTMMSNFSPEHPEGQLTGETLKSFFSVKEHKDGTFEWIPGHDAIPYNWYRRPETNLYGTAAAFGDFGITLATYPQIAEIGGNTGKPNSFVGVNLGDVTGGAINGKNLLKGNNLACLAFEGFIFAVPELSNKIVEAGSKASRVFQKFIGPAKDKLGCPELTQYDTSKFNRYPGFTYQQPLQPATPY